MHPLSNPFQKQKKKQTNNKLVLMPHDGPTWIAGITPPPKRFLKKNAATFHLVQSLDIDRVL